jgi:hypothetical protein
MHRTRIYIAFVLPPLAAVLVSGCAGLTSQRDVDQNQLEGLAYYMPMKHFALTVTKGGGKVTALTWSESDAFPDLSRTYALRYNAHLIGKTTILAEVGPSGLLGKANTATTDSAAALATVTPSAQTTRAKSLKPTDACAGDGSFVFLFPDPKKGKVCGDEVEYSIERIDVRQESDGNVQYKPFTAGALASPVHLPRDAAAPGLFYRLNRPYVATAAASASGQYQTKLLFVPNESPNFFLPFGRTLFAANDGKVELTDGVLKKYEQENDGEFVALLKFPASVLSAYFTAVGNVFSAFALNDKNEAARRVNDLKVDLLRLKIEKCREALAKRDDATMQSLQCDALAAN